MHLGAEAGPLFQSRGERGTARDGRLETRSVLRIVRKLGQQVGLNVWCRELRHTAIATVIEHGSAERATFSNISRARLLS